MAIEKKNPRVLSLDILRGYFLMVIAIDHFQHFPSLFDPLTGRGRLWVSAAEGFFIISGLVVGYIYGPKMAKVAKKTTLKIWRRAALLWALCAGFTLLFTIWGIVLLGQDGLRPGLLTNVPIIEIVYKAATLQYIYGWVDFLALYAVFMLAAPAALYLTVKKQGLIVVLASIAFWLFAKSIDIRFGWQIFFIPAIVVGFYLPQINIYLHNLHTPTKKKLYFALAGVTVTMLVVSVFYVFSVPFVVNRPGLLTSLPGFLPAMFESSATIYASTLEPLFYKWTVPLGRVVFAWVWFITLYILVRHYEQPIERFTRGFFSLLGRNSLFTYCFMGVVIFGLHFILTPTQQMFSLTSVVSNTLLSAGLLALIYWGVRFKEKQT